MFNLYWNWQVAAMIFLKWGLECLYFWMLRKGLERDQPRQEFTIVWNMQNLVDFSKRFWNGWGKFWEVVEKWSDCNWTRTQNHLVLKRTLNHLAKLVWATIKPNQNKVNNKKNTPLKLGEVVPVAQIKWRLRALYRHCCNVAHVTKNNKTKAQDYGMQRDFRSPPKPQMTRFLK